MILRPIFGKIISTLKFGTFEMNKQEFIEKYNIRDALPIDPSLRVLPGEGFALGIEEFINERFRGVAKARATVSSYSGVLVCPEYVAMFFKTLFTEVYGRSFINISITSDNERLTLLIEPDEPLDLTDSQMRNLIRLARNGGMKIYPDDGKIRLTLLFSEAAIRRVYAISVGDGRSIMLSKMAEIFFSGELYSDDDKPRTSPPAPQKKNSVKK